MTLSAWFSLFIVALLGAASPGPSLAVVVKNTLGGNKINGFLTAWSHAAGIGIYAILTVLGLAILLKQNPFLFQIVSYGGALYLAWLGIKIILSKGGIADNLQKGKKLSYLESMRDGIMISALNPKIGLFFIALFSQFINPNMQLDGKIITILTPPITDGLWYSLIALVFSHSKVLNIIRQKANLIDKITGVIFILLAISILFE